MKTSPLKILYILLTLCLLACKDDESTTEFTLMTYNIYHGEHYYNRGESNLKGLASVINRVQPDFIAMQEVDSMTVRTAGFNQGLKKDLVKELEKLTRMHGLFGKAIDYNEGGYGEGLLSAEPVVSGIVHLPTPEGGEGRALIYATYTYDGNKKVTFAATHLCHEYEKNRVAQIRVISDFLLKLGHPVVLAGDLNFREGSAPYNILAAHWTDAAKAFGNPENTIPANAPKSRIDYIWVDKNSAWDIRSVDVPKEDYSDHMPVVVKAKLKQ
ncbi:Metal-dependent hydrolase, endonuclease/exonuclease/phosphatase family [Sinomicrobium oceani]|uniref:Metal-dependent hydrolase, endonuclease/exonuclease/phosphatase family n=1 Tax=Sinomicrobium oceani TaxID=1150368 RepID=A0A1K1NHP1_9FLAO|nr:endonuclease/exonuclease/phosphatase family protein [Sinomicrobium oceani]SFW33910.1 Metal-dependent hydrolase, endonuclease/exonuclease/phosphatase family [Sinomicrobium oceani]